MANPDWSIMYSGEMVSTAYDLRRVGYRSYAPMYRRLYRRGTPQTRLIPVFGALLFVQDWRGWPRQTIRNNYGFMRGANGNIATIPDEDIAIIMRKERELEYDEVRWPVGLGKPVVRDDIEVGDSVTAERFGQRIVGTLEELTPRGRAIVNAVFFGRPVRTEVDAADLEIVAR